jgi:hypothetical protein
VHEPQELPEGRNDRGLQRLGFVGEPEADAEIPLPSTGILDLGLDPMGAPSPSDWRFEPRHPPTFDNTLVKRVNADHSAGRGAVEGADKSRPLRCGYGSWRAPLCDARSGRAPLPHLFTTR